MSCLQTGQQFRANPASDINRNFPVFNLTLFLPVPQRHALDIFPRDKGLVFKRADIVNRDHIRVADIARRDALSDQ